MTVRSVVLAEHVHGAEDLDPGRVHRHQDLRLALVRRCVRVGLHHHDHDLAARITGARDVVLLAVDHPLVAVTHGATGDVLGVRRRDVGLGHRVRRTDLAVQQRLQPLLLLLGRADPLEHLHVAGVGSRAVEALGGDRVLAELDRDVGVVEVGEPLTGVGVGEEEVPQPLLLGLGLDRLEQVELAVAIAPALGAPLAEPEELLGVGLDLLGDEPHDRVVQRPRRLRHAEVVHVDRALECRHRVLLPTLRGHIGVGVNLTRAVGGGDRRASAAGVARPRAPLPRRPAARGWPTVPGRARLPRSRRARHTPARGRACSRGSGSGPSDRTHRAKARSIP